MRHTCGVECNDFLGAAPWTVWDGPWAGLERALCACLALLACVRRGRGCSSFAYVAFCHCAPALLYVLCVKCVWAHDRVLGIQS